MKKASKSYLRLLFLLTAELLFAGFGCGKNQADLPKQAGEKFIVAYEPYKPFLWNDNGTPRGFDYDLASEVARRNDWQLGTRLIRWGECDQYLNSGAVDVLWNGMNATPERRRKYECGANYLSSGEAVVVSVKSGIKSLGDLAGKRIVIQSTAPIYREFVSGDYRIQGQKLRLLALPDFPDMRKVFENGDADALITDYYVMQSIWGKNPDFRVIPKVLYETENVFGVKKGRIALRDQIQDTLQDMVNDGTFQKIRQKWFGDAPAPVRDTAVFKDKKILVLHSGNVYFPRSKQLFEGFSNYLDSQNRAVRYDVHGLNVLMRNEATATVDDYQKIQLLINNGNYDLIVVNNNSATDPFLDGKITVPQDTPILCMSYHGDLARKIRPGLNMTGIVTPATEADNLALAVRLNPQVGKIVVISEFSSDGIAQERAAKRQLPKFLHEKVEFISGNQLSTAELIDYCARLNSRDAIILSSWASNRENSGENAYTVLPRLREATRALILGKYDSYIDGGADGGVMTFNTSQGKHAGQIAERILLGERASDIPVATELRQSELKYAALTRLGLPIQNVPENIAITDAPDSWVTQHQYELAACGGGLAMLVIMLVVILLWQRQSNKRLFKLLQERDIAFAAIGDGVLITDVAGKVVMLNPAAEKMTGFGQKEAAGRPHEEVFQMVSYLDGTKMPSPVRRALAEQNCIALANHTDLIAKDGSRLHIADSASPIFDAAGVLTGCIMVLRDVTREYNDRDRLRAMYAQLETGAKLTNASYFNIDMETQEFTGGSRLSTLWPSENGKLKRLEQWVVAGDRAAGRDAIRKLQETGSARLTFRSDWSGAVRTYHLLMSLEHRDNGRPLTIGVIQDITEIIEVKEKLAESQSLWKQVMDSMPLLFFAKNVDTFRYEMANQAFAEFCGFASGDELIGKTDEDLRLLPDEAIKLHREINEQIAAAKSHEHREEQIRDAGGCTHALSIDRQFFCGQDGTRLILCSIADTTALQRNMEDQLAISECMELLFGEADPGRVLPKVLEKLCGYVGASRAYVLRFNPETGLGVTSAEYFTPGGKPLLSGLAGIPYSVQEPWYKKHLKKQEIMIPDMDSVDTVDLLGNWDRIFRAGNAKSVFVAASQTEGVPTGELGFIFENEPCGSDAMPRPAFLTAAAHLMKIVRERSEAHRGLLDSIARQTLANEEKTLAIKNKKVIGACLENLLADDDLPRAMEKSMRVACEHIGAPRSGVFCFNPANQTTRLIFSYAANGISLIPEQSSRERASFAGTTSWRHRLEQEPLLRFEDITPEKVAGFGMSRWADVIGKNAICSIYVHRIMSEDKVWGCILLVFEQNMRKLTDSELEFLSDIARCAELMLQRQKSQERLQNALRIACDADKAKSYFIASLSHEIRTPLNAVIGYADLLKVESDADKKSRYTDSIAFAGEALLLLISDLLDLSKLEAGKLPFNYAPSDCVKLCESVIKIFKFRAEQRGNSLEFRHGEIPLLSVDEVRIRQIIFNFLGNAVKFTENGQVVLAVDFKRSPDVEDCGTLTIEVADTGIGIAREDLQKLWEPFVQLSGMRGTNASNSGTGLGLAVVKRLTESMNGSLSATSEVGKGSVFGVAFNNVKIVDAGAKAGRVAALPDATETWQKHRILLVDDVAMNLQITKAICNKLGVESVAVATSGAAALALLKEEHFDLILTDIWMPKMNGVEFAAAVRKLPEYQQTPVIAITADIEAKETFPAACFDQLVFKPVTRNKLQEVLRSVCEFGLE